MSWTRFARPLHRYRRHIDDELCPWFENERLAVLGINTARSLTFKDGRISHEQMAIIRERFAAYRRAGPGSSSPTTRFSRCRSARPARPARRSGGTIQALQAVAEAGVHVLLAGHFHRSFTESARRMVRNAGPALVIQAGTATSIRLRHGETQSFNLVHARRNDKVDVQVVAWDGKAFRGRDTASYAFDGENWEALAAAPV